MKLIFDFDNVLFSSNDFKNILFSGLEEFGVSNSDLAQFYKENRKSFTNPRSFYYSFIQDKKVDIHSESIDEIVEGLFVGLHKFLNQEFIEIIKRYRPENCFIVSVGDDEFQRNKIKSCEIEELFGEIHIVGKDKNETLKRIIDKFPNEEFVFVDDNNENIERAENIELFNTKLHIIYHPHEIDDFRNLVK